LYPRKFVLRSKMQPHPEYYFRVPFTSSMIGICDKVRTLKNFNDSQQETGDIFKFYEYFLLLTALISKFQTSVVDYYYSLKLF
jgi:hypothetical protein